MLVNADVEPYTWANYAPQTGWLWVRGGCSLSVNVVGRGPDRLYVCG